MVGGKGPVHAVVQQDVAARKAVRERAEHGTGGAVSRIPRHGKRRLAGLGEKARDVGGGDIDFRRPAGALSDGTVGHDTRQFVNIGARKNGPPPSTILTPL